MRAVVWHGRRDVRIETVPDPTIEDSTDAIIRDREELAEQIRALGELKEMAAKYGFDISGPASNARVPTAMRCTHSQRTGFGLIARFIR